MFSFKENIHPIHYKTPYSRLNAKTDKIVSKIVSKQRISQNNYGRNLLPSKPLRNTQALRNYEEPSTSFAVMDDVYYPENSRNRSEYERVHFYPRKPSFETSFDHSLELKMMSIEDTVETSEKTKSKTQETAKGFQIKPRQNLLRVFTGSVENILCWSKLKTSHHILFEVTANVVGISPGKWKTEKIFYLSDSKSGSKLQVFYQEIDRPLPKILVNSLVTCIGRLLTRNRLQAYKVQESTEEQKNDLQRISFICNRVADELVAANQTK